MDLLVIESLLYVSLVELEDDLLLELNLLVLHVFDVRAGRHALRYLWCAIERSLLIWNRAWIHTLVLSCL